MRCVICSRDAEYIYKGSSVCTECLVGLTGGFEVKAHEDAECGAVEKVEEEKPKRKWGHCDG